MEIHTIGGYNEVGKNMTVVDLGDDAFMFDAGFFMPAIVELQEQEEKMKLSEKKLREIGALPEDNLLDKNLRKKIRAIFLSHAHLDHIGAVPYISYRYNAPVYGTPFTIAVLKQILRDESLSILNKMISVKPNETIKVKGQKREYLVDFINMTHSTPQTAMIALHSPEGVFLYSNDFKIDNTPVLGLKPNYYALRKIADKGVKAIVVDSLYSGDDRKTPSEKIARALVEEVLLTTQNRNSAIFVSTFSSHIARLKSICDFSKKINRKVIFLGRSLKKYVSAAKEVGVCPFYKDIYKIGSYRNQVASLLKKVEKEREKYVVVLTGHQGEPGSVLERLSRQDLPFKFRPGDHVIFSSKTIPVPINMANKERMDKRLKKEGVRIFDNVHVSGHAGREDLRDLISIVNPEHIIPAHGSTEQLTPMIELAREMGYSAGKECHLAQDKQCLKL